MDRCPPEIHGRIFDLACSDDGTTGRSLSSVSRWFRTVSSPYQWQSLVIYGQNQVYNFSQSLRDADKPTARYRRRIYHLFICDRAPRMGSTPEADVQLLKHKNAVHHILTYAAPTLDTLTYFSTVSFLNGATYIATVLGISYPDLTELTIRGRCTPMQIRSLTSALDITPTTLPNLQRLHLALPFHGFSYGNLDKTQALAHTIAPHITHFRLTLLDMWGSKRVSEIVHAELSRMGIAPATLHLPPLAASDDTGEMLIPVPRVIEVEDVESESTLLPSNLALFVLQPSPTRAFYCSCCMEYRGDVDVMPIFEKMADLAQSSTGEGHCKFLYLGSKRNICMGYGPAEARMDWLEGIAEGGGCWRRRDYTIEEEGDEGYDGEKSAYRIRMEKAFPNGDGSEEVERSGSRTICSSIKSFVSKVRIR